MKKHDAVFHFKSQAALARAAGVSRQAVWDWGEFVPPAIAELLQEITDGALKYDPSVYPDTYRRPGGRLWTPSPERPAPAPAREAAA